MKHFFFKKTWLITVLVLVGWGLAAPGIGFAQTSTPIQYGQTVTGEITAGQPCQYYRLDGSANDPIEADMVRVSGDLDGILSIYLHDGNNFQDAPLAFNDDRQPGVLDPLLTFTLPATDWYTLTACAVVYMGTSSTTGTFSLALSLVGAPPGTPVSSGPAGSIQYGSVVTGRVDASTPQANYSLAVSAGDRVSIQWVRTSGNLSPAVGVADAGGAILAQTGTRDIVSNVELIFQAPSTATLTVYVTQYGGVTGAAAGEYELSVQLLGGGVAVPATTPVPAATLAIVLPTAVPTQTGVTCSSAARAVPSPASSSLLSNVYTAAGDGYTVEELTATSTFRTDDDLNVIFTERGSETITVGVIFCSPAGESLDAGTADISNSDTSLLGLDWEYNSVPWVAGKWYAEVYVNGNLDLSVSFLVK